MASFAAAEASRAEGLVRLEDFAPKMGCVYAGARNYDRGEDAPTTSRLSPWLRRRLVTEEEAVATALARHGPAAAEKFVSEVLWRTYWKGYLEQRPSIWSAYAAGAARDPGDTAASLAAARRGETGLECFDAWARELVRTGFLHNHVRMWFASIWCFTLELPWEQGAAFFLDHLIDGDPASNTLSWRWVAGLHTQGKHYLARAENIERYTGGRFNPEGLLNEAAPPLKELATHPVLPLAAAAPAPPGAAALLLHEDDLHPESLDLAGVEVIAVGLFPSRGAAMNAAAAWSQGARADALARSAAFFRAPAQEVDDVSAWAEAVGARSVVTPWAPVGLAAARLTEAAEDFGRRGIALHRVRRSWDTELWPHARRGFFPFREAAFRRLG